MTTAIIGTGGIGSVIARQLASGGETLRLSSADHESARTPAEEIGRAAVVAVDNRDALQGADAALFALRFVVLRCRDFPTIYSDRGSTSPEAASEAPRGDAGRPDWPLPVRAKGVPRRPRMTPSPGGLHVEPGLGSGSQAPWARAIPIRTPAWSIAIPSEFTRPIRIRESLKISSAGVANPIRTPPKSRTSRSAMVPTSFIAISLVDGPSMVGRRNAPRRR
jgi:hypothetical protein